MLDSPGCYFCCPPGNNCDTLGLRVLSISHSHFPVPNPRPRPRPSRLTIGAWTTQYPILAEKIQLKIWDLMMVCVVMTVLCAHPSQWGLPIMVGETPKWHLLDSSPSQPPIFSCFTSSHWASLWDKLVFMKINLYMKRLYIERVTLHKQILGLQNSFFFRIFLVMICSCVRWLRWQDSF